MDLASVLALVAVILFTLTAIGVATARVSLGWLGLAVLALAFLLKWEGVNW